MSKLNLVSAAACLLLASGPALAEEPAPKGNADAGHSFANSVCAECHSIERGAKSSPNLKAPPFASMINSEKLTPSMINGWLVSSHTFMPDFSVPADKRADLIAYIESLALNSPGQ